LKGKFVIKLDFEHFILKLMHTSVDTNS